MARGLQLARAQTRNVIAARVGSLDDLQPSISRRPWRTPGFLLRPRVQGREIDVDQGAGRHPPPARAQCALGQASAARRHGVAMPSRE